MTKASVVAMLLVAAASVAAQERAPNRSEPSALAWEGQRAFTVQGCYGCHTIGKFGTPIGPDLSHIAVRLSRRDLERIGRLIAWLSSSAASCSAAACGAS